MKSKLLFLLLLSPGVAFCQDIMVTISPTTLTAHKYTNEKLVIPIDITMELSAGSVPGNGTSITTPFAVSLSSSGLPPSLTFAAADFAQISLETPQTSVQFDSATPSKTVRVCVIIPAAVAIVSNKALMLQVLLNGVQVLAKQLSIQLADDIIYSRSQYIMSYDQLDYVVKVESADNILTISGYKNHGYTKRKVLLEQNQVLGITEKNYVFGKGYLNSAPFSLVTVPFKIRPNVNVTLHKTNTPKDTIFTATAMSGITSLGINIDIVKKTTDRYFASGKKATHKIGIGIFLAPGVEELNSSVIMDTSLVGDKKSKQFYISGGISIFYSYNGITFFVVPAALDWAPSSLGKQWIYNKKFWWGFGIGLSPTIFNQVFNK